MYEERLNQVREAIKDRPVGGLILQHSSDLPAPAVRWLTGFTGSNALVYLDAAQAILVTDGRYAEQVKTEVRGFEVHVCTDQAKVFEPIKPLSPLGFDPDRSTVVEHAMLEKAFAGTTLRPISGLFSELMAPKSDDELAAIKRAQTITDEVFGEILEILHPGMTEQQVAAEIVYRQLKAGADMISPEFWPIVASGYRSALPHATATKRKLQHGEFVLLDFGCMVDGYNSDMTRVVSLGNPGKKARDVYEIVLRAQTAALAAAKAGTAGKALDAVGRDIIESAGYELPHSLGHGVGLEVHEYPTIGRRNNQPLPGGAVITIEPGIYLPGEFGVRIEDMVILTTAGNRNLTESPKDLIML